MCHATGKVLGCVLAQVFQADGWCLVVVMMRRFDSKPSVCHGRAVNDMPAQHLKCPSTQALQHVPELASDIQAPESPAVQVTTTPKPTGHLKFSPPVYKAQQWHNEATSAILRSMSQRKGDLLQRTAARPLAHGRGMLSVSDTFQTLQHALAPMFQENSLHDKSVRETSTRGQTISPASFCVAMVPMILPCSRQRITPKIVPLPCIVVQHAPPDGALWSTPTRT
ncbi:hypothetical protein J3458_002094 [Metarhizium acridum]|uniref:uncharacterized protein n=1 Tax=Metarhizium acridum TaxID=92637 RepID=UPI001C6B3354|nr:hypothetical protein J3458_002094 [Metarhizium acridum]